METCAYPAFYLPDAKRHLGACTDYLVRTCGWSVADVGQAYATSRLLSAFGRGDSGAIAGLSGIELAQRIASESSDETSTPSAMPHTTCRSPEYWTGWALAHLQWHLARPFSWILRRMPLETIRAKYAIYHEMDLSRFLEDVASAIRRIRCEPNLRRLRRAAGLSQTQLAKESGVHVRSIQLYEQRVQDINRASAESLRALSKCLSCAIEDIMEHDLLV